MKILILAPSLDPKQNVSGISSVASSIIRGLKNKHTFYHYRLGRKDKESFLLYLFFLLIPQLIRFPFFCKSKKIDLVHQNIPFDAKGIFRELVVALWADLLRIPIIMHIHGGGNLHTGFSSSFTETMSRILLQRSSVVVVLSEVERVALIKRYFINNVVVLSNAVSIPQILDKKFNTQVRVLFLGRICREKGVFELVEAINILFQKGYKFSFFLCGEGPETNYVVDNCRKIMGDSFEYYGVVTGEIKEGVLKNADVFLLPSYFEGVPISLLETMSYGIVPIITDLPSIRRIVCDQENGIIVRKKNSMDIAKAIENIILDKEMISRMSTNAKETISQQYEMDKYLQQFDELYCKTNRI